MKLEDLAIVHDLLNARKALMENAGLIETRVRQTVIGLKLEEARAEKFIDHLIETSQAYVAAEIKAIEDALAQYGLAIDAPLLMADGQAPAADETTEQAHP